MCREGCRTQDHSSWGECARAANLRIQGEMVAKNNKDLNRYAYARSLGLQPKNSTAAAANEVLKAVGA